MNGQDLMERPENAAGGPEGVKMAQGAADAIAALQSENAELQKLLSELTAKYETVVKIQAQMISLQEKAEADLARVEAERDVARPSKEVLEAIDELVEYARPRMTITEWLGFANTIAEWRSAQGEA